MMRSSFFLRWWTETSPWDVNIWPKRDISVNIFRWDLSFFLAQRLTTVFFVVLRLSGCCWATQKRKACLLQVLVYTFWGVLQAFGFFYRCEKNGTMNACSLLLLLLAPMRCCMLSLLISLCFVILWLLEIIIHWVSHLCKVNVFITYCQLTIMLARKAVHYFGRALRETGQALDRVGLRVAENEIFRDTFTRHRPTMVINDKVTLSC